MRLSFALASLLYSAHAGIQDISGLVRYYSGDNTLADGTGSGNDLVAYQVSTPTTAKFVTVDDTVPFSTVSRGVLQLEPAASNAYNLKSNANDLPEGNADRTIMAWMKITGVGTGAYAHVVSYGGLGNYKTYSLIVDNDNKDVTIDFYGVGMEPPSLIPIDPDFTTTLGQWRHFAMTHQGREAKSYINGVLATQGTLTADLLTIRASFGIGANFIPGNYHSMNGLLAEVAIFNRALSAQELLNYVNNASSGGDPHYVGFGNMPFSWQGSCDTVLVKTPPISVTGENLEIQIRTRFVRKWSAIDLIAIKYGGLVGQIDSSEGHLVLNGTKADSYESDSLIITKTSLKKKMMLYTFVIEKDKTLEVKVNKRTKMLYTTVKGSYPKGTVGLLGSPHNPGFYGRNGTQMDLKDVNAYVEDWQVNDQDPKLFEESRPPQFPDRCKYKKSKVKSNDRTRHLKEVPSIKKIDAIAACIDHPPGPLRDFCVEDVLSTGDLDIAQEPFYG